MNELIGICNQRQLYPKKAWQRRLTARSRFAEDASITMFGTNILDMTRPELLDVINILAHDVLRGR